MILQMMQNICMYFYVSVDIYVVLIFLLTYGLWNLKRPHSRFPPGPIGIPFFGSMFQLRKDPEKVVKKWSLNHYGPVMSVPLANQHYIYLNTYEAVQAAFLKQGSKFSGRPNMFLFHQVSQNYGLALKTYGEDFKVQRKFGNKILRGLGFGQKKMEDIINREGDHFIKHLEKYSGRPVNIKADIYNLTSNIICGVALGRRFEYDDPMFREILLCTEKSMGDPHDAWKILMLVICPKARFLPFIRGANERYKQNQLKILGLMKNIVKEHKETFNPNCLSDFIDAYLYEQQHGLGKGNNQFEDRQLEVYVRDLFFAGTETSSNTICWGLLILLHYPEFKSKIEEEIAEAIGWTNTPSVSHRENMPFTCAFLQELVRFRTLTPGGSPHCTTEPAELFGYHIPKGTMVMANIWGVNNDPSEWPNPEVFDPYRHINDNKQFVHSSKIIPFSMGPRVCLGEQLARMEIFIIMVKVLQHFKVEADAELPSLQPGVNSVLCAPQSYKLVLSPH
ncbi:cytochrome P450 2C28-like [Clavelina lepadiformis]|uniref:cytochrome P450 2C28-like n=1 Tax=Clavelina lepadiformis TaxID=159417 RepID=UPI004042EEB2